MLVLHSTAYNLIGSDKQNGGRQQANKQQKLWSSLVRNNISEGHVRPGKLILKAKKGIEENILKEII